MITVPTKVDCYYIVEMLDSGLINYQHTQPWADKIIEALEKPPTWLFDISLKKYQGDQISAVRAVAYGEPFTDVPNDLDKFHLACLWLRYERRELSWAILLREIGDYLDAVNGEWDCETPYHYLNLYEEANFSEESEKATKKEYLNEQDILPWIDSAIEKLKLFQ